MLTRDEILKHCAIRKEVVSVPEWGGDVYVKVLTVGERLALEKEKDGDNSVLLLVASALVGEDDEPLFDRESLKNVSAPAFLVVAEAVKRINKMGVDDAEVVKGES